MLINHKKLLSILSAIIFIVTSWLFSFNYSYATENIEVQPYGLSRPIPIWNIATKGSYPFSGTINNHTVTKYSDYKFNGKTSYKISVKNLGKKTLYVKTITGNNTITSSTVKVNHSKTIIIPSMNKTTSFYLTFKGSSYSGTVK